MPTNIEIIPMPKWSVPIGCTKLVVAIIILAFTAACTAVWGGYSAFCFSLFTASTSLVAFGYYLTALSFNQRFYNKYLILALETHLTLLWLTSLILLAGWTGASLQFPFFTWSPTVPALPYGRVVDIQRKHGPLDAWHPPGFLRKRNEFLATPVSVHGQGAHRATQILAGLSAGLAGIEFILYGITLIVFVANMIHPSEPMLSPEDTDVEVTQLPPNSLLARQETQLHSPTSQIAAARAARPRSMPPAVAAVPAQSLPAAAKNEETETSSNSAPQPQEWSCEEAEMMATRAGIQPPTPVMKALIAERQREERQAATERRRIDLDLDDINPILNISDDLLLSGETRGDEDGLKGTEGKLINRVE